MGQTTSRREKQASVQKLKSKKELQTKEEQHPSPFLPALFRPPWPSSSSSPDLSDDIVDLLEVTELSTELREETVQNEMVYYTVKQLRKGVNLKEHKKYWIDKEGKNCFMLFARALKITWIEDEQFWKWTHTTVNNVDFEVAKLLDVCWLEIRAKFNISLLSPDTTYEVVFVVKREEDGYGWEKPVNLVLKNPNSSSSIQPYTANIQELPGDLWVELKAGELNTKIVTTGEIEFSLYDYKGGLWKRGLLVLGAIVRPR